ncbi:conjugal transfer protein TraR [Pseudoalteromonas sp. S3776]|uniref:TraR/DksA C4-type zinc finger protein n=1 Tax=unclassified Pseudoalteromonas TaxID=194690 RepID=UPI001109831C|nr:MULTISPECIES: conjugal transfer protein TraR [unclassified Pseudoalteromonas]TMO72091.1 conjugal transfer protein TraR [Pseudoalteromonas sp. S3785]TMO79311.1 conjugal transfer protein TraR [Pseudoalteromonas sp. S3776]
MLYQQQLHSEIAHVKSAILAMLNQSSHPAHLKLRNVILTSQYNEWLDTATYNLGPEYQTLVNRLAKLEAAISQIDIGQYGYCCDCEEAIAEHLLKQDPATQRCEMCAKRT